MADSPQITDLFTLHGNERKLYADYVTAERQKWRVRIRELVIETVKIASKKGNLFSSEVEKLHEIRAEFRIRLNLDDPNDWYITEYLFKKIIENQYNDTERLRNLSLLEIEVSWLLKEDWERVKYDTRPLWEWRVPKVKVDRSFKTVTDISIKTSKEYSAILTFVTFMILLCLITFAVGWTYQQIPSKKTENEQASAAPMTFSPLIINAITGNTNGAEEKKSVNHQKHQEKNLIFRVSSLRKCRK